MAACRNFSLHSANLRCRYRSPAPFGNPEPARNFPPHISMRLSQSRSSPGESIQGASGWSPGERGCVHETESGRADRERRRQYPGPIHINHIHALLSDQPSDGGGAARAVYAETHEIQRRFSAVRIDPQGKCMDGYSQLIDPFHKLAVAGNHKSRLPSPANDFRHQIPEAELSASGFAELVEEKNIQLPDSRAAVASTCRSTPGAHASM